MRLIDADAFKSQIAGMAISNNYPANKANALCELIDAQPAAYDLDKVVEQLEKVAFERYGNDGMGGEMVVNMDDAIEIVKGGGVK
uniref:hypothetical protein n=1 Tax=Roseburia sp. TaxID=2049040 RepID=UPI003FF10D8A